MKSRSFINCERAGFITALLFFILANCGSVFAAAKYSSPITEWQTYYATQDGLPDDHIFALKSDGERLWVGTEGGLACFENETWQSWTDSDGLPWEQILAIDVSKTTGDVWLASFGGGLIRYSGGRFDQFTQLNSGLVNDVVYGVAVVGDEVWAATAAGVSSFNVVTGEWRIFTEKNAPMEEIWCYNIHGSREKIHVAVWGGGVLEYDTMTHRWDAHRDPDREMEIDLYRDDGLVHNITTAVSYIDETLWAATYFGLSRYDGRKWRGFLDHDSGLTSNFINFVYGIDATSCLVATDKGLSLLVDSATDSWVTYSRTDETATTWTAQIKQGTATLKHFSTNLTLPNHFVISTTVHKNGVWIGTGHGLARGFPVD